MKQSRGFTLVEMAVVVVIIAALLTLGLGALNAQLSSASYTTTKQRQAAIKDALIAYLGSNKSFPCPQTPTVGTGPKGLSSAKSGTPPTCQFGIVPFSTLGLAREVAQDGWGNFFSYQVYAQATLVCPGLGIDWGNSICFGSGKINSGFTVNDGTVSAPTLLTSTVVAVVISHGPNGLGAWGAQGTRNVAPTTCEEFNNAVNMAPLPLSCTLTPNVFYKGESQDRDDVVGYLTASDAIQQLVKQGAINSASAQVNTDLQTLYDQTLGAKRAGILISGSPPTAVCTNSVSGLQFPDPWGNSYVVGEQGVGNFPICICSGNSATLASPLTCSAAPPTAVCKFIDQPSFNSYLFKQGAPTCP